MKTFTHIGCHARVRRAGTLNGIFGRFSGGKLLENQAAACRARWERRSFIVTPIPRKRSHVSPVTNRSCDRRLSGWDLGVPPRMAQHVVCLAGCIALLFAIGCGGEDLPQPERRESYYTVIDDAGTQREIRSSSLIDEDTGQPVAKQIFVVDRQSNRRLFLDVTEWQAQSPSQMRYVPVRKQKR